MLITEPFIIGDLIENPSKGLKIKLYQPKKENFSFKPKNKWDDNAWSTYFNILHVKDSIYHMYYRGNLKTNRTNYHKESACLAISTDNGFNFKEAEVSYFDHEATTDPKSKIKNEITKPKTKNNIIWKGIGIGHNFFAFKKDNKMYAIGSVVANSCRCCGNGIILLESNDGLQWDIKKKNIINSKNSHKQGYSTYYDSMNVMFWDSYRQHYWSFLRYNEKRGMRNIQVLTSKDIENWGTGKLLKYYPTSNDTFYVPFMLMYPNSPYFLGFPSLQQRDNRSSQTISLLFSRNGYNWTIIKNKWLGNLSKNPERFVPNILTVNNRFHIYVNDAKQYNVNLYTIRKDGFGSIINETDVEECFWYKNILQLSNNEFILNYIIMKNGYIALVFFDLNNNLLHKFDKMTKMDDVSHIIQLPDKLLNKKIKLKVLIKNAEIFSFSYHSLIDNINLNISNSFIDMYNNNSQLDVIDNTISEPIQPVQSTQISQLSQSSQTTQTTQISQSIQTNKAKLQKEQYLKKEEDRRIKAERRMKVLEKKQKDELEKNKKEMDKAKELIAEKNQKILRLRDVNRIISKNHIKEIKYQYIDFMKNNNVSDYRYHKFGKPVSRIDDIIYDNRNPKGGDCPDIYGRKASFKIVYFDNTKETINIINNGRSNCKLLIQCPI